MSVLIRPRTMRARDGGSAVNRIAKVRFQSPSGRRFEIYDDLQQVFRVYSDWKQAGQVVAKTRELRRRLGIPKRRGAGPLRVLVEASNPGAIPKQKSKWVRALQYAARKKIAPQALMGFLRAHGGLAGCARRAARVQPKRANDKSDWD